MLPVPRHLYVHVPFCARRCSYCDFSIAVRRTVPVDDYLAALAGEIAVRFPAREPWTVETVYIGGGTPSLLGGEGVARLFDLLFRHVTPAVASEITLEANPDDVTVASARLWRHAGVNRLSLGSQSFDDRALMWMHRTHGAPRIAAAVGAARGSGIGNVSLDLIFALPEALGRHWEHDLASALALAPTHLSLYGLTIEPATPLGRWRERGAVTEAPEETYEREFLAAHDQLRSAGFEHYEVSSFALPGFRSGHNSSYWRGRSYVGLGPAAHSFDGTRRRWNVRPYAAWARAAAAGRDPAEGEEVLTAENLAAERVYLGLRASEGLVLEASEIARVGPWLEAGWGVLDGRRFSLTPSGWLRLDALACDLTVAGSRS